MVDGVRFEGGLEFATAGNGATEGIFTCATWMANLGTQAFNLISCSDEQPVEICDAFATNISARDEGCVVHTTVRFRASAVKFGNTDARGGSVVIYELTNLEFMGSCVTQRTIPGDSSSRLDCHRFTYKNLEVVLQQSENYDDVIKRIKDLRGVATTATMEVRITQAGDLTENELDQFAESVCELLSFATKNTVQWVRKTLMDLEMKVVGGMTRYAANLRPFISRRFLIPDAVADDNRARFELLNFLNQCIDIYCAGLRERGMRMAIAWKLDSEHQTTLEMQYLAAFICIEWMKTKLLTKQHKPAPTFSKDWQEALDGPLGTTLEKEVTGYLGDELSELQRRMLFSGLRNANNAPIAAQLKALCEQFSVTGFEKEMSDFRSKLVHTGDFGNFSFEGALELFNRLSHVIDQIMLKALEFDGFYVHAETQWRPNKIARNSGKASEAPP